MTPFGLQPFSTMLVGSLPRTKTFLRLYRQLSAGEDVQEEFEAEIHRLNQYIMKFQADHDLDLFCSGHIPRYNYLCFVAEHLDGVSIMSMADMLPYVEDKKGFETILQTLDVPAVAMENAIATGKITRKKSFMAEEAGDLLKIGSYGHPLKVSLPGVYALTRSMWLAPLSGKFYDSKEDLGKAVIRIMQDELQELAAAGVKYVQFDEPVLTEVVFSPGKTRTFMCAALAEKKDPAEELAWATSMLKEVFATVKELGLHGALHVCRGNWSKDESILLKGPYTPLVPLFEEVLPEALVLEFSTPRAGELSSLFSSEILREKICLGLGVCNPRTDEAESVESMVTRCEEALQYLPPDRLFLCPDCGFAPFANRPVNTYEGIGQKIDHMCAARDALRAKYC